MEITRLAEDETSLLLKSNRDFISHSTLLYTANGTYSIPEVIYYYSLILDIYNKLIQTRDSRRSHQSTLFTSLQTRSTAPLEDFEKEVDQTNHNLAAEAGLGKKYGQPKRIIQEKLKGEMSKCVEAQSNIDQMLGKLNEMYQIFMLKKEEGDLRFFVEGKESFSLKIRKLLMVVRACVLKYALHLNAFNSGFVPMSLSRITYVEEKVGVGLSEEEKKADEEVQSLELENLGTLGFKTKSNERAFESAVMEIDKEIKGVVQKLYTDQDVKYLQGADRIPLYLELYLSHIKVHAQQFRLDSIRKLRTSVF
jgi:hypothetical protein